MGRPPLPLEHHRRVGRANGTKKADGRALPEGTTSLAPVVELPAPLADFDDEGRRLWERIWTSGRTWIAITDIDAVEAACRLADDIQRARRLYREDPADGAPFDSRPIYGRLVASLDKQLQSWFSQLGFTPTARSRLGVAEVKAQTAIEQLRARRRNPDGMAPKAP